MNRPAPLRHWSVTEIAEITRQRELPRQPLEEEIRTFRLMQFWRSTSLVLALVLAGVIWSANMQLKRRIAPPVRPPVPLEEAADTRLRT